VYTPVRGVEYNNNNNLCPMPFDCSSVDYYTHYQHCEEKGFF